MRYATMLAMTIVLTGCGDTAPPAAEGAAVRLESGIDQTGMDTTTRPQDDFFAYANGAWVAATEIPGDQTGWGSFLVLRDNGLAQLRTIVEDAGDGAFEEHGRKLADFYASYMNADRADALGIEPIADLLSEVDALESHEDVLAFMGDRNDIGIGGPFGMYVGQDRKSPDEYILTVVQSGLGLPDRDYYFDDSERGTELIAGYEAYVADIAVPVRLCRRCGCRSAHRGTGDRARGAPVDSRRESPGRENL